MTEYIISRAQHGTINGRTLPPRCFITGPHFGADVFGGTQNREEASRFSKAEAEKLCVTKSWTVTQIEEA